MAGLPFGVYKLTVLPNTNGKCPIFSFSVIGLDFPMKEVVS